MYFHGGLLFFAYSFSNTAILTLPNFSIPVRYFGSWKLLIHTVKQENIRHPILCSGIRKVL